MTPRLNLIGWTLLLSGVATTLNAQDQGALDADFQDGGTLLLAPFESTSFENAQDVLVLDDGSIVFCGVAGSVGNFEATVMKLCLLYTSPSPRDQRGSRMPSSA